MCIRDRDYRGTGMSVMEMSHRSPEYEEIQSRAEQALRRELAIGDEYAVLFVQGGGSLQFTMVPVSYTHLDVYKRQLHLFVSARHAKNCVHP